MKIIGLTGPAGSGKSTVARLLGERHGYWEESFAAPIREFIQEVCGLTPDELAAVKETPIAALCGKSPRYAMQTLGTEWGRHLIGADLWLRALESHLNEFASENDRIVISDVRFANEANWIRERGDLWHLTRPGAVVNPHASELGITPIDADVLFDNDCDLDALADRIAALVGAGEA